MPTGTKRKAARTLLLALFLALLIVAPSNTSSAPVQGTRIRDVQGAGHVSPLRGARVANLRGVVTHAQPNGFFMQDPQPDDDRRTSEGIFVAVATGPSAKVGDEVSVSGTVREVREGEDVPRNPGLTVTQIEAAEVGVRSSNNPLPEPQVVGVCGLMPPERVIWQGEGTNVEASATFRPEANGLDFYESLEGMLVRVNNPVAVGPSFARRDSKEVAVLADAGAGATLRTPRGGILLRADDPNPERLFLLGPSALLPDLNVGDRFDGAVTGVMDYSGNSYRVLVKTAPGAVSGNLKPNAAPAAVAGQLSVAAFNVENLDAGDPAEKFESLARIIVENLRSPDLISVEEIQDNNGRVNDAVVDASETFAKLIAAIRAAGGPIYHHRSIDPVDDQDGGESGGNIRVGFMFRTDRGLRFVDRPGGGPMVNSGVAGSRGAPRLSHSPGRLDPSNPAFKASRKPLAGEFTFNGHKLFVVANHFASKGGDQPPFGRFQPPALFSEEQRKRQAEVVAGFTRDLLRLDPRSNLIVLGDLNDFEYSDALKILKGVGLFNLMETLPEAARYTYVYRGNSQTLDHLLVSARLTGAVASFTPVHVNSEFFENASDHDPTVAIFNLPRR